MPVATRRSSIWDFNSGAMVQNIVDRAKKSAIKDLLTTNQRGLRVEHLLQACTDEFRENEDLPNTTNPGRLGRISGKKGADRLHPHPHQDQGGWHRAREVDHGQHRAVPLTAVPLSLG